MHADIMLFRSLNSSVVRGAGAGDIMHRTGQSDEASQPADELTWRDELSPRSTLTLRYDVEVTAAELLQVREVSCNRHMRLSSDESLVLCGLWPECVGYV